MGSSERGVKVASRTEAGTGVRTGVEVGDEVRVPDW